LNRRIAIFAAALFVLALSGCASLTRPKAPDFYQIDYAFEPSDCSKPFPGAVRIWSFSASAPYDREQMVAVTPSRNVRYSSHHKWISPPGDMLADILMRDLSLAHVFEDAVPVGSPVAAVYEMSGHVYRFALEENGSPPHAALDVEITMWRQTPPRSVLFRKHFHYRSAPLAKTDPLDFADAMSGLASRLSMDLRDSLCAITSGSSRPDGG
jgi:ABC-type uncharacterized transport system auxiliary subunit